MISNFENRDRVNKSKFSNMKNHIRKPMQIGIN